MLLEIELNRLGATVDVPFTQVIEALRRRESPEADEACRVFGSTLRWPQLSAQVRLDVCLRLACGVWYCRVTPNPDEPEGTPLKEAAESLLIDYWLDVGREDFLHENFVLPFVSPEETKPWPKPPVPDVLDGPN